MQYKKTMIEIFKMLLENKLTPNMYYLLISIKEGVSSPGINPAMEYRSLTNLGFIDNKGIITEDSLKIIEDIESMVKLTRKKVTKSVLGFESSDNIDKYLKMWDMGKLPSSKPARDSKRVIEQKFAWFFQNYSYSWDLIIKATAYYIDEYEKNGYKYMRTSSYFITKTTSDKIKESDLANYCELILNDEHLISKNNFSDKVV